MHILPPPPRTESRRDDNVAVAVALAAPETAQRWCLFVLTGEEGWKSTCGATRFSGLEKPSKNRTICIRGGRKRPASPGSHKSARSSLKYGGAEIFGFGHVEVSKNPRQRRTKGAAGSGGRGGEEKSARQQEVAKVRSKDVISPPPMGVGGGFICNGERREGRGASPPVSLAFSHPRSVPLFPVVSVRSPPPFPLLPIAAS